ncbi:MAG: DegT/DnrJ/EryC1/StrS family aminotransferase [Pseudomonadota bacterium]
MLKVALAKPVLGDAEAEATARVLKSGWVTQGPEVKRFEQEFAQYVGAKHACAVSNCTVALHLGLIALGIGAGDEVITVSHSYIATANAIVHAGATPVFVDINRTDFNIDPSAIAAAITPKTKAILCVHQMGMPCDMPAIMEIAKAHNLKVVEDAACAIGSEIRYPKDQDSFCNIGYPMGDLVCFSMHPRKVITTGDGGMITTNDDECDTKLKLLRQHGMAVPDTVRHASNKVIFETYPIIGYNQRMTDIQAAVGREQLKRLPGIVEERNQLANQYSEKLRHLNWIELPTLPKWATTNWQSYCILLDPQINQREFMQYLLDRGVSTRRGIMCAHREKAYDGVGRISGTLSESEYCQDHGVVLPLYPGMTGEEQSYVIDAILKFPA